MPDSIVYTPEEYYQYLDTTTSLPVSEKAKIRSLLQQEHLYEDKKQPSWLDENMFNVFLIIIVIGIIFRSGYEIKKRKNHAAQQVFRPMMNATGYFVYKGCDLDFGTVTLEIICLKYNAFFRMLDKAGQQRFLEKLQAFMKHKYFYMYGEDCYREMPVLLSATATQLSFGLQNFHLDNYPIICIQPQEYFGYEPLRILTGNVQGNTITISWKHFLKDNLDAEDGNNVGLHEMAHAFAMQMLYAPSKKYEHIAVRLRAFYNKLNRFIIYEKQKQASLFDAYSLQNADECWAKCIELYFEKKKALLHFYPELYTGIKQVLNQ